MTSPPPEGGQPAPFVRTPNAERYLLEADNLRRRQLRSALLHGSSRTWRDRRRLWPAAIAGVILVAVISAAIAVYGAFQAQQENQERRELGLVIVERVVDRPGAPPTGAGDWSA